MMSMHVMMPTRKENSFFHAARLPDAPYTALWAQSTAVTAITARTWCTSKLSLEPMQTKPPPPQSNIQRFTSSGLSRDPLPLLIPLRHVRHRKSCVIPTESALCRTEFSTVLFARSVSTAAPTGSSRTAVTYTEVNSASTYPPFPHPSTPTCTGSGDIGP